jgi:hypothetical protein
MRCQRCLRLQYWFMNGHIALQQLRQHLEPRSERSGDPGHGAVRGARFALKCFGFLGIRPTI